MAVVRWDEVKDLVLQFRGTEFSVKERNNHVYPFSNDFIITINFQDRKVYIKTLREHSLRSLDMEFAIVGYTAYDHSADYTVVTKVKHLYVADRNLGLYSLTIEKYKDILHVAIEPASDHESDIVFGLHRNKADKRTYSFLIDDYDEI